LNIRDLQNKTVQVENHQTTFLILNVEGQSYRFDFLGKKEFYLKKGTIGLLRFYEKHPLLINHIENSVLTYINSKPDNIEAFLTDFKNAINEITQGWRKWSDYVSQYYKLDIFINNVKNGRGYLLKAPFSITQNVVEMCNKHHVETKTIGNELIKQHHQLIFIADNFVIAREFKLHMKQQSI
jgi:hypothetical protein